jgi:predicted dehydrogenase
MQKLNIALVGAGRRGRGAHLPVIARLTDVFNFVAVCDVDSEVAASVAAEHGVRAYTSVRDMVKNERLDVADVVVPGDAHAAVACFLMQHGVNILVETPIAPTLPEADVMIRTAAEHRVRLEVAENYYRAPLERLKTLAIGTGAIGEVSRIYRIFYEGGYHGMSVLRHYAGGEPKSILGIAQETPVIPHTDRMKRHHERERWTFGLVEFDNGVNATMIYSNIIHARSLGRGQAGVAQIDGTRGAIVGEEFHVVPDAELETGARSTPVAPRRVFREVDGVKVLVSMALDLPAGTVTWENPFARYPLTEGQVPVADELVSIANAVREGREPDYGTARGRQDQEMNLAMSESARLDRRTLYFPITTLMETERTMHERFRQQYGRDVMDLDGLVDVFFPRR